jgi:hypothetical protein
MKFEDYIKEGRTDFWKDYTEYFIRELGKNKYEVSVWKRGDTPSAIYTVSNIGNKWMCDCPARKGTDKHVQLVKDWIKAGKPSPFGKDVKDGVLKSLKKMGVKI